MVGCRPEQVGASITLARAGRTFGSTSGADGRRRDADRGADAPRVPPRRLLDDPATRDRLAVLPDRGPGGARRRFVYPDAPFAQPLDGGRGRARTLVRRNRRRRGDHDGRAWRRLFGPLVRHATRLGPELLRPVHPRPAAPAAHGPVRLPRPAFGRRPRPVAVPRTSRRGPCSRDRRPRDAPPGSAMSAVVRPGPRHLAHAVGWPMVRAGPRPSPTPSSAELRGPRGRDRRRPPGRRPSQDLPASRAAILDVTPRQLVADRRRSVSSRARRRRRAVPLRLGRVQGGLGARRPGALGRRGPAAGGDGPPRGHARGGRGGRSRRRGRARRGSTVRPVRPVRAVGPDAGPDGRTTAWAYCHVPAGSHRRHDRQDRGPGRTLRARFPRPDHRPGRHIRPGQDGGARRELRRAATSTAGSRTSDNWCSAQAEPRPVSASAIRPVPVLVVHAAGRWRARHGRGCYAARSALRRDLR